MRRVFEEAARAAQINRDFEWEIWESSFYGKVTEKNGECTVPVAQVRPSLTAAHFVFAMTSKFAALALEAPFVTDDAIAKPYARYRRALAEWKEARLAHTDLAVAVDAAETALHCSGDPERCDGDFP